MTEGRFWPTEEDSSPLQTRFHVPKRSLLDASQLETNGEMSEVTSFIVIEEPTAIQDRLHGQFPLYRAAMFGKSLLQRVINRGDV